MILLKLTLGRATLTKILLILKKNKKKTMYSMLSYKKYLMLLLFIYIKTRQHLRFLRGMKKVGSKFMWFIFFCFSDFCRIAGIHINRWINLILFFLFFWIQVQVDEIPLPISQLNPENMLALGLTSQIPLPEMPMGLLIPPTSILRKRSAYRYLSFPNHLFVM